MICIILKNNYIFQNNFCINVLEDMEKNVYVSFVCNINFGNKYEVSGAERGIYCGVVE